jgi:RHS repeat-associated protein
MSTRRAPSETTSYAWDTSSDLGELALETNSKGKKSQTSVYTYGEGPIGIINDSGSFSFHTDSLGSMVELSDSSGSSLESYRYSPYGEADSEDGSEADSPLGNSLRYAGQYLDSETDLYDMRAREYDAGTGRFLEIDPLEAAAGDPSVGVYVYVDDRPTVEVDPSGECPLSPVVGKCEPGWRWPKAKKGNKPKLIYPFPKGIPKKDVGGGVHQTGDLPGYPAIDFGAPAGTKVLAVVSGRTWWESGGTDPSIRPVPHSVYGWTFYLKSDSTGITYFYSHLQTRLIKNGPPNNHVKIGQVVGTLDNWHQWGMGIPDHLHLGAKGPANDVNIWKVFHAPQVKPL